MSKQIRPLVAFKRQNPEVYLTISNLITAESKKGKENEFYFYYTVYSLGVKGINEILDPAQIKIIEAIKKTLTGEKLQEKINTIKKATYHLTKTEFNSFFYTIKGELTNIGTVSETGRLLLTGWYYNIEDYTKEIGGYVYNAYKKIEYSGDTFNDLDFQKAVKHIRENIIYYYQNEPELKLYIIETFFKNQLQELLPPPDKLKEYNKTIDFITEIKSNQKRKGIDFWINKAEEFEGYSYYLQELIEDLNLEFLTFNDWIVEYNKNGEQYLKEINNLDKEYRKQLLNVNIKKLL